MSLPLVKYILIKKVTTCLRRIVHHARQFKIDEFRANNNYNGLQFHRSDPEFFRIRVLIYCVCFSLRLIKIIYPYSDRGVALQAFNVAHATTKCIEM